MNASFLGKSINFFKKLSLMLMYVLSNNKYHNNKQYK